MNQLNDTKYEHGEIVRSVIGNVEMQIDSIKSGGDGQSEQYLCVYFHDGEFKTIWLYGHNIKKDEGGKMGFGK